MRHKTQAQIASSCVGVLMSRPVDPQKMLDVTRSSASTEQCCKGEPSRQGLPRRLLL